MTDIHLSIRVDFAPGVRIGPGKIALLEAIRSTGSITAAAKSIGMSYRRAWLLVDEINRTLQKPAVATKQGGSERGGTTLTPVGEGGQGIPRTQEIGPRSLMLGEMTRRASRRRGDGAVAGAGR